jgi:hypothetical protein
LSKSEKRESQKSGDGEQFVHPSVVAYLASRDKSPKSTIEPTRISRKNNGSLMAANASAARPSWQRNSVFRFFASLKLAVVLLAVLIIGAIAGTIYESSFDAKVARAYVYGAPWFNLWLVFLAANLTVSALSRWPWKKHHVAFLITHLGIITLLAGSLIGRIWGIEGTITLFKDESPNNRLLVDQHQFRVHDTDGIIKGYAAEFIHRPPTKEKPWDLGPLASGARLSLIGYAPAIEAKLNPKPSDNGMPALHFTVKTAMMGQNLDSWLLADDAQSGSFSMGLANIELKRGAAPIPTQSPSPNESKSSGAVEIEESIFAFAKATQEQIARVAKGGSSGVKIQLVAPHDGDKGAVSVVLGDKTWTLDVAENLGKEKPLEGSPFTMRIEDYWPDFRITNGKPGTISDQPNNPATIVTIKGTALPAAAAPDSHGNGSGAPPMPAAGMDASANHLTLFVSENGEITYDLTSRKLGHSSGKLALNQPLATGWADWQLTVDQFLPHAVRWMDFNPAKEPAGGKSEMPDGVLVRIQQNAQTFEQWVPAGWEIAVPTSPNEVHLSYGWKQIPLPIALELLDFEVKRNEGSDAPAGFKSTVRVSTAEGDRATGQCWMNNPFSYPTAWWRSWSGLTYKMSQASWNPENLSQSTIQILRDPGWLLKWIGSLLIVIGIFLMFYVRGFRKPTTGAPPIIPAEAAPPAKTATAEFASTTG